MLLVQKSKGKGRIGKDKSKNKVGPQSKEKEPKVPKPKPPKEGVCFYCNSFGRWKKELLALLGRTEEN